MYSNKSRVPRLLIFIIWLLLILSIISTGFSLSLRVFGLDSPHPIYWLIGYSFGSGPLWSLACIVPVVIGICSVVMIVLLKRYAESIRYQVMGELVGSVAVLGMIGGAGLIVANMTWAIWTPLASDTLNGHVFHLALWSNNDKVSSSYYVFRCDGADLFCDQIAVVAPCKCFRPSLTIEEDPRLEVDQAAQTVSVTIKGTEAYLYQSK